MASRSTNGRKPATGSEKPKRVRKRVAEIPQLDDDKIYAEVLQGHFDGLSAEKGNGKKSRRRKRKSVQRKWWWPKHPLETTPERKVIIDELVAIREANDYYQEGTMPPEYMPTDQLILHLNRLKAGLIPMMTKKGILSVKTPDNS